MRTSVKISILVGAITASALLSACSTSTPDGSAQQTSASPRMAMRMDTDKQMPQMQENMKKMQQHMEKIRSTLDPAERRQLMQEHMQAMQGNMKMMRDMGGPTAMACHKGGMPDGDMMKHHEMMGKRMEMMQMMMEQMMQRDHAMESMPGK